MQLVLSFANHKPRSIGKWYIIFGVPYSHVLCLEIAIHYKALHEKIFAVTTHQQLPGINI
jgi:hypothetical protein